MTTWNITFETKSSKKLLNIAKFIKDARMFLEIIPWLGNCFLLYSISECVYNTLYLIAF